MQIWQKIGIFTIFVVVLGLLPNEAYAAPAKSKQKQCIEKTMPWEDISKCIEKAPKPTLNSASASSMTSTQASAPSGSLNADVLFNMINTHRASIGLPAYQKDERICQVARDRGPELYNEIFVTGAMHAGFYARNLPYWATENMISQGSEQAAFNWWMNSSIHRRAIESPTYTHSCGACYGNSCAQIFTAFQSK